MKGPIRQMVEHLENWAKASGLTIAQVADVFDKVNRLNAGDSTDEPVSFETMPTKGKH
jgi:hypothetical protein